MDETSAREVLLLQAFETAQPPVASWTDGDRAWATRLALQDAAGPDAAAFLARRAHHAMQRLAGREPAGMAGFGRRVWRGRWVAAVALAGFVAGLVADSIGSAQRINLLAPPLAAVLLWNLLVGALLVGQAFAQLSKRRTRPGVIVRTARRLFAIDPEPAGRSARPWPAYGALWLRASAPLSAARASTLLHAAAAALGTGLIAGLYLRGLVLDYRVAWESTFLSAATAHGLLSILLAPASAVTGIALPDVAALEALRNVQGEPSAGASAAAWIHLYAATLAIFVVLPRTALAFVGGLRSRWMARHLALPLDDAYFQSLRRQQRGEVARAIVVPYASAPGAAGERELQALLSTALDDGALVAFAPMVAFGAEDDSAVEVPSGTTLAVALFDLAATPEVENHGRFARGLAARVADGAATVLIVDETSFRRRFGAASPRITERRDAWRVFAEGVGTLPVFVDRDAPDADASRRALQLAQRSPVKASP